MIVYILLNIFVELTSIRRLLLLMLLGKVGKKKLRDSNSQLKHHINGLEASVCALKSIHVSGSCRAEIAGNLNLQ